MHLLDFQRKLGSASLWPRMYGKHLVLWCYPHFLDKESKARSNDRSHQGSQSSKIGYWSLGRPPPPPKKESYFSLQLLDKTQLIVKIQKSLQAPQVKAQLLLFPWDRKELHHRRDFCLCGSPVYSTARCIEDHQQILLYV